MAISKARLKQIYPLSSYKFRVEIYPYLGHIIGLHQPALFASTWSFSDVSGLDMNYEHSVYRDGLSFAAGNEILRGVKQPPRITLSRGIVRDRAQLAEWMQTEGFIFSRLLRKKNLRIIQLNEENDPEVFWNVVGAVPVKLVGPSFKSNSNEVSIEAIELMAEDITVNFNL